MSNLFDDHPNVVVLDRVVRKLILQQCQSAAFPDMALADWQAFLQQEHELFVKFGFREGATGEEISNAISVAGEFERLSEELTSDFKDDGI